ncbi:hypothetical protein [Bacillus thuringiensis]|uniref:hypothetical protein n=1 Tax=Bacillus thuringiensis TaxID=1428 RepID=UPI0011A32507|nr:hypothetical protein [Bacillus thuringiensis]
MELFMVRTDWKKYFIVRENLKQAVEEAHKREGHGINMTVKRIEEIDGFKVSLTPAKTFDKCFIHIGDKVIECGSGYIR